MGGLLTRRIGLRRAAYPTFDEKHLALDAVRGTRVGQRQTPLQEGVRHVDDARRDPGRSRQGTRGAKWLEGKTPKKVIVVPGKIINIVI